MNDDSTSRIVASLQAWIAAAAPGARLPSTRALVSQHAASPVTVQRAISALAAQGLVEARPGVGTFVRVRRSSRVNDFGWQTDALGARRTPASGPSAALRHPPNDVIALHSGFPDRELLPERLVRAALVRAARSDAAVTRAPVAGLPELQSWFARELGGAAPADGAPPDAGDVVIVPGSQSGLSSIFRALVGAGGPLLIESPTYWGAIAAAAQAGVRLVPIPSGPTGPEPGVLDRAFERTGARALYAQPSFANPTGALWSGELADAVLEVVRSRDAFLIEDDWAHDFGIEQVPVAIASRDVDGHVVHVRSLTKSVSPAIRVAGITVRGPARGRILADVQGQAQYVSPVLQAAALDVVTQPAWRTHLRGLRRDLAGRRDLLVDALREHVPAAELDHVPQGGLNLWLRLPERTDVVTLARDAEAMGVTVAPGDEWFPAEPAEPRIRLNYAGPNPAAYGDGARAIARALESQRG